jgi:hypothetical protein
MIDSFFRVFTDSPAPLALAGLLYVGQMFAYLRSGEVGMATTFGAYALANAGLYIDFMKRFN